MHKAFIPLLIMTLTLTAFGSCRKDTEEDKVRKVVAAVAEAAGEKEIKSMLGQLSRIYRDPKGNNYDGIRNLLLFYFYRHQRVSVFIARLDVTVTDRSARAQLQAVLSGARTVESAKDLLPEALGIYDFDVTFMKEGDEWKITSADWKRSGEGAP
ncbi:MAG: hypothetical protein A2X56_12135 [Nitrospirae bacterium GWC2_57_13]|jgi:hypothetical protein|nr:MAG: hypothetical protein A2X56_12135 [Nitrospirae bacterium GWC2_57_13]OGW42431.1 MAG: hypothetical protein A2X57_07760 [Nitrospirae bacterium GWD2_57_8]HAS53641.1 hypothetical protein [Nitrospiraceae bacterium]